MPTKTNIPEQFIAPRLLIRFFPELTSKQVYVLTFFCLGVSVEQISIDLGIKSESVCRQLLRIVANLIQEQKDFGALPQHQQIAVIALGEFLYCVVNGLKELNEKLK